MTDKIRQFVPWNANDADATLAQLSDWIRYHKEQGHEVGLVACLITMEGNPNERYYQPCYTPLPVEVIEWATKEIQQNIWRKKSEPT